MNSFKKEKNMKLECIKEFVYKMKHYNNDDYLRSINRIVKFIDNDKKTRIDESTFRMLLNFYELC
jgi:hypothetical protein